MYMKQQNTVCGNTHVFEERNLLFYSLLFIISISPDYGIYFKNIFHKIFKILTVQHLLNNIQYFGPFKKDTFGDYAMHTMVTFLMQLTHVQLPF